MAGKKRIQVDSWKTANIGVDSDPWLTRYRYSVQAYGTGTDTLEFYTRLFLEAPVAIVVTTPRFRIADVNVRAQQLLGANLKQMRGRMFQSVIARSDRPFFSEVATQLLDDAAPISRPLRLRRLPDGEVEVMLNAVTMRSEDGEPEFISFVLLDRGENVSSDLV